MQKLLTIHMTRPHPKALETALREAIRADRARGLTMRQIAHRRGVSVGVVHKLAADVHVQLPNAWHQARLPKAAPTPYLATVHRLRSPR